MAMGSTFEDPNDLFPPPYIPGDPESDRANREWQSRNRNMTYDLVDELRMPRMPAAPRTAANATEGLNTQSFGTDPWLQAGAAMVGLPDRNSPEGRVTTDYAGGDPRGDVDPLALVALAQGGPYDIDARRAAIKARRDAIAKQLTDQQMAAAVAENAPAPGGGAGGRGGLADFKDSSGTGSGDTAAATGATPGSVTQQGFFETAVPSPPDPNNVWSSPPPAPSKNALRDEGEDDSAPGFDEDAANQAVADALAAAIAASPNDAPAVDDPTPNDFEKSTPTPVPDGFPQDVPVSAPAPSKGHVAGENDQDAIDQGHNDVVAAALGNVLGSYGMPSVSDPDAPGGYPSGDSPTANAIDNAAMNDAVAAALADAIANSAPTAPADTTVTTSPVNPSDVPSGAIPGSQPSVPGGGPLAPGSSTNAPAAPGPTGGRGYTGGIDQVSAADKAQADREAQDAADIGRSLDISMEGIAQAATAMGAPATGKNALADFTEADAAQASINAPGPVSPGSFSGWGTGIVPGGFQAPGPAAPTGWGSTTPGIVPGGFQANASMTTGDFDADGMNDAVAAALADAIAASSPGTPGGSVDMTASNDAMNAAVADALGAAIAASDPDQAAADAASDAAQDAGDADAGDSSGDGDAGDSSGDGDAGDSGSDSGGSDY